MSGVSHVTGNNPERVVIVGCGPTMFDWHRGNLTYESSFGRPDEVWTLNKALRTVRADVGFVMDDMTGEAIRSAEYRDDLDRCGTPIITSIVDDEVKRLYPSARLHRYPIQAIINYCGYIRERIVGNAMPCPRQIHASARFVAAYMHNSIPYILAYALFIGVRHASLFGCDYTFPGQAAREDDRANAEYWVGLCRAWGMIVDVPETTTLLNTRDRRGLYGYGVRQPVMRPPSDTEAAIFAEMYRARYAAR